MFLRRTEAERSGRRRDRSLDIHYVLPFVEAPQVGQRPASVPEGAPAHFYRLRLAERAHI